MERFVRFLLDMSPDPFGGITPYFYGSGDPPGGYGPVPDIVTPPSISW